MESIQSGFVLFRFNQIKRIYDLFKIFTYSSFYYLIYQKFNIIVPSVSIIQKFNIMRCHLCDLCIIKFHRAIQFHKSEFFHQCINFVISKLKNICNNTFFIKFKIFAISFTIKYFLFFREF